MKNKTVVQIEEQWPVKWWVWATYCDAQSDRIPAPSMEAAKSIIEDLKKRVPAEALTGHRFFYGCEAV